MKRFSASLVLICSLFLLTSCQSTGDISSSGSTSNAVPGAMAGAIGGTVLTYAVDASNPLLTAALLVPAGAVIGYYIGSIHHDQDRIALHGGTIFQIGDYLSIVIPADVLFDVGTSSLLPAASPLLDEVAAIIKARPEENVLVSGHTDGIGSELYQAKLSRSQAYAFGNALWQRGAFNDATAESHQYVGFGDSKPITAETQSNRAMALNRRIQITLYPKKAQIEMHKQLEDQFVVNIS